MELNTVEDSKASLLSRRKTMRQGEKSYCSWELFHLSLSLLEAGLWRIFNSLCLSSAASAKVIRNWPHTTLSFQSSPVKQSSLVSCMAVCWSLVAGRRTSVCIGFSSIHVETFQICWTLAIPSKCIFRHSTSIHFSQPLRYFLFFVKVV